MYGPGETTLKWAEPIAIFIIFFSIRLVGWKYTQGGEKNKIKSSLSWSNIQEQAEFYLSVKFWRLLTNNAINLACSQHCLTDISVISLKHLTDILSQCLSFFKYFFASSLFSGGPFPKMNN